MDRTTDARVTAPKGDVVSIVASTIVEGRRALLPATGVAAARAFRRPAALPDGPILISRPHLFAPAAGAARPARDAREPVLRHAAQSAAGPAVRAEILKSGARTADVPIKRMGRKP